MVSAVLGQTQEPPATRQAEGSPSEEQHAQGLRASPAKEVQVAAVSSGVQGSLPSA